MHQTMTQQPGEEMDIDPGSESDVHQKSIRCQDASTITMHGLPK